jgi:hypothetical protein
VLLSSYTAADRAAWRRHHKPSDMVIEKAFDTLAEARKTNHKTKTGSDSLGLGRIISPKILNSGRPALPVSRPNFLHTAF